MRQFNYQVDIPLSVPFYKWLLGKEHQLSISDMEHIDPEMARTLISLDAIAKRKALLMVRDVCSFSPLPYII